MSSAQSCVAAPPQTGFKPADYTGVWFEIGKIQTAGGAIFESSCVCTQLIVAAAADPAAPGDATVLNSCRDKTPQGAFINASAQLVNMAPPGHWDETFVPPAWKCVRRRWQRGLSARRAQPRPATTSRAFAPPAPRVFVNYTVIFAGVDPDTKEEYSVEYDCNGEGLFNNYCVHILARKPTMSAALMDKLVKASLALNLNTQNLPFNQTLQEGCW